MAAPSDQGVDRLRAYIIDSDSHTRHRLKEATMPVFYFEEVIQFGRLNEALSSMEAGRRCDVAFLASSFDDSDVANFILSAKKHKSGQDTAFVSLIRGDKQEKSSIAQAVMNGLDGFLFEPYSVDALSEIAHLASRVRKDRSVERERVAVTLMISDAIRQIDLVAYIKSCELEPAGSLKRLRDICTGFGKFSDERRALYYELAIELFGSASLPSRSLQGASYKGASLRVKKKMADKMVAETEAQMGSPVSKGDPKSST